MPYEYGATPDGTKDWVAPADASKQPEQQENTEQGLKKNDLKTSETYRDQAKAILEENKIHFELIESSKRVEGEKGYVPGQFIFRISDPVKTSEPASPEYMKTVYALLKEKEPDMPIAFGDPTVRQ